MHKIKKPCGFHCIKMKDIGVQFGDQVVLEHINLHIHCGSLTALIGRNGAGKSTLLKTIAGILSLKQGEVWFDAQPLSKMNATEKSQHIAYLAQNTQIHWDLSVYDVIALGLAAPLPKEKERSKNVVFFPYKSKIAPLE